MRGPLEVWTLEVLAHPYNSLKPLERLTNPERGAGPEARGPGHLQSTTKELFSYYPSIKQGTFFKILMSSTQVTYHFQCTITPPPIKSVSFSTEN